MRRSCLIPQAILTWRPTEHRHRFAVGLDWSTGLQLHQCLTHKDVLDLGAGPSGIRYPLWVFFCWVYTKPQHGFDLGLLPSAVRDRMPMSPVSQKPSIASTMRVFDDHLRRQQP